VDVTSIGGGGASGGLGAGLYAFLGAALHPRYSVVMQYLDFDQLLADADLVFTAEGSLDYQTPKGKIPAEVARRAKRHNVPVIAIAGTLGQGVKVNISHGIDAFASILSRPCSLQEAIASAPALIQQTAENILRSVLIGQTLSMRRAA
jgi:glycerate 2-kinase